MINIILIVQVVVLLLVLSLCSVEGMKKRKKNRQRQQQQGRRGLLIEVLSQSLCYFAFLHYMVPYANKIFSLCLIFAPFSHQESKRQQQEVVVERVGSALRMNWSASDRFLLSFYTIHFT